MSDDVLLEGEVKDFVYPIVASAVVSIGALYCEGNNREAIRVLKKAVMIFEKVYDEKKGGKRNGKAK